MAFCKNCGAAVEDGAKFCAVCGNATETVSSAGAGVGAQSAPLSEDKDAEVNKAMGVLAYLGFLVLVPIFAAKESPFARYHANQGLVLFLAEVAIVIVNTILTSIFIWNPFSFSPVFTIISIIFTLLWIGIGVLAILGIVNAVGGKKKPLPIIGGFKFLK